MAIAEGGHVSNIAASGAMAGLALVGGLNFSVLAGALCGAAVYMLSNKQAPKLDKAVFFVVSTVGGVLGSRNVAALLSNYLPVTVHDGVGAMLAATLTVSLLSLALTSLTDPGFLKGLLSKGKGPR